MKNKFKSRIFAVVVVIALSLASCPTPGGGKDPTPTPTPTVDRKVYVMDVSKTSEWDYMMVGTDGSSLVFNIDKSTGIPTRAFVKPKKDSDIGLTFLFKENGLPDMMICNGYIYYFTNFNGYEFDMAVIYPDDSEGRSIQGRGAVEKKSGVLTDFDWDALVDSGYHIDPFKYWTLDVLVDALLEGLGAGFNMIGHVLGTVSCVTALTNPISAVGCGIYVLSTITGEVVKKAYDGTAEDVNLFLIDALNCATKDLSACLSTTVDVASFIAKQDLSFLRDKSDEVNKAIKDVAGINYVPVTGVRLQPTTLSLAAGTNEKVSYTVLPENATNKLVTWTTSDYKIASFSAEDAVYHLAEGIYGFAPGKATITVTTNALDGKRSASCAVTVTAPIAVTGVTINKTWTSLPVGQSEKLTATVQPSNATDKRIIWSSSNDKIADVDFETGLVTAVAAGTADITVATYNSNKTATCTVTVTNLAVTGVTIDRTTLSLPAGHSEQLTAAIQPPNASNKSVTWTTSNPAVATVSEGSVKAEAEGTAVITVKTEDGNKTAACTVTVTPGTAGVTLDKTTLSLSPDAREKLSATVLPATAANKSVTWTSSNPGIATVDSDGWVTAKGTGTATITATTWDGKHTATCTVTVTSTVAARIEMVQIPAGTFTMGSPPDEKGRTPDNWYEYDYDEGPQHQVTLSAFYMGKYEVTQKQWYEVMGKTIHQQPDWIDRFKGTNPTSQHFEDGSIALSQEYIVGDNYPMYLVNWYDTIVFCNRLSMQEGLSPAYSISGSTDPSDWGGVPDFLDDWNSEIVLKWASVKIVAGSTGYRLPTEAQWEYACRAGTTTPFNTGNNLTSAQAAYGGAGDDYNSHYREDYEGNTSTL